MQNSEQNEKPRDFKNTGVAPSVNPVKKEEKVIDRAGHYDLDGVSYSEKGVVIASNHVGQSNKPDQSSNQPEKRPV